MKNRVITTLMSRAKTAKAEHQRGRAAEKRGKYGGQIPQPKPKMEPKGR